MAASPAVEFATSADDLVLDVSIPYGGSSAIVRVHGELDFLSAPDLRVLLEGVIARGHHHVALDLARVSLLSAAAIGVIATTKGLAQDRGGELTIRAPSRLSRRVLDACSMSDLIEAEPRRAPAAIHPSSPIAALLAMARSDDVIDAVLNAFTALTQAAVAGADGASVTLARNGRMTTVGASNETIAQMDRDQYATGEGPCLAAAAEGQRFHIESIATELRWPEFVRRAMEDGIASILSTPLVVDGRSIGALNIYSNTDRAFEAGDEDVALLFADHASVILSRSFATTSDAALADRFRGALDAREVIALAQGVLMARGGITAEHAYAELRHAAREAETTIRERATMILAPVETGRAPT